MAQTQISIVPGRCPGLCAYWPLPPVGQRPLVQAVTSQKLYRTAIFSISLFLGESRLKVLFFNVCNLLDKRGLHTCITAGNRDELAVV